MSTSAKLTVDIAAETLIARLNRALSDRPASRGELNELVRSLSAIPWSQRASEQAGRRPINLVLARLRQAETDRPRLLELVDTAIRPITTRAPLVPNEMEQWEAVTTQFSLRDQAGPLVWPLILLALQRGGYKTPADIAGLGRDSLLAISPPPAIGPILLLRKAPRAPRG